MTGLYEQLQSGGAEIELREAWDCWKVVARAGSREECLEILSRFQVAHPAEPVKGKLGRGDGGHSTFAVMFHTEGEEERDRLEGLLRAVVDRHFPGRAVFHSRGCGIPYETLLGPWPGWTERSTVLHPERIPQVKDRLRSALYRC